MNPSNASIPRIGPVRKGQPITANWANQVARAIAALSRRYMPTVAPAGIPGAFPFRISVTKETADWTATVAPGHINAVEVSPDATNTPVFAANPPVQIDEGSVTALTAGPTWGIFLEASRAGTTTLKALDGSSDLDAAGVLAFIQYQKSDTETASSLAAGQTGIHVFHIGDVTIDASTEDVAIAQHVRSDIWVPDIHTVVDTTS